jgi:hypothetical protein
MAQRTAAPRSLWPLVKTESKAQKIDSEWYAESRCETRFLYHPFYRTFTPAAALADIWQAWPAASLLWVAGFAYAVRNLWATR